MKKYPFISPRLEEDYHFIKDDILLVNVYTTRNVTVRGMLIPNAFLTDEIRTTDDYKEYETVFINVAVPMNQPQSVFVPKEHIYAGGRKRKNVESYADKFAASMIYNDIDDFEIKIEPGSHKEHLEFVDDDDDNEEDKKNKKKDNEMCSLEIRTEKMQTPIPIPPRSSRIMLSSDKNINHELTVTVSPSTTTSSKDPHKKRYISNKYSHLTRVLRSIPPLNLQRNRITTLGCYFKIQAHES
nr:hypothetical protein [Tanacetum cinerariifolium]